VTPPRAPARRPPTGAPSGTGPGSRTADWVVIAGSVATGALNYVYSFLVLHLVAPPEFAAFAYLSSLLLVVGTFSGAALPFVLARRIATAPRATDARADAVGFAVGVSVVASLVSGALVVVLAARYASPAIVALAVVGCVAIFAGSVVNGCLQGEQRFTALAVVQVAQVAVKVVAGALFILAAPDVESAIGGFVLGAVLTAVVGAALVRRDLAGLRLRGLRDGRLWRDAIGLASVQGVVSVLIALDVVALGLLLADDTAFAAYQAVLVLARIPVFIATALAVTAFTPLAGAGSDPGSDGSGARVVTGSLHRLTVLAGLCTAGVAGLPDPLIAVVLPDDYPEVRQLLLPLALAGIAAALVVLATSFLRAAQRFRSVVVVVLAASGALVVALALAGGRPVATAWVMAAGVAATAAVTLALVRREWPAARPPVAAAALAVAATVALPLAHAMLPVWLLLVAVAGAAGLLLLLRPGALARALNRSGSRSAG
jgi:O-antigen/teichoic acid export membrane protein